MDNLRYIIGPAPSELDFNEFLSRLSQERDRVRRTFIAFRSSATILARRPVKRAAKVKAKKPSKAAIALQMKLDAQGINKAEFEAFLAQLPKKGT